MLRSNQLIKMMERFEINNPSATINQDHQNEFYQKLHDEIIHFRDSVKDILHEMQPIKE